MSRNPLANQPPSNLSVGNVVSAGLRIYRDRFQQYYGLALKSILWLIVPVYGWAKSAAILGLISRLAFGEVAERPESVADARRHVYPRKWTLLVANILVALIFFGAYLGAILVFSFLSIAFIAALSAQNAALSAILGLLTFLFSIGAIVAIVRLISRLCVYALCIAIEEKHTASSSISRSWNLTKDSVFRLQLIWFVTLLITLPVSFAIDYFLDRVLGILILNSADISAITAEQLPTNFGLYSAIRFILGLLVNAIFIPIYQSIQAVIYYDLISRKEGFDLNIRNY